MATTVVPWVTSSGTVLPEPSRPAPGRSCGATRRRRSTKDEPGSRPGAKVGRGDSITRRAYTGPFSVPVGASVRAGSPVGVVHGRVHGTRPPFVPRWDVFWSVDARVPRRTRAGAAAVVPGIGCGRGGLEGGKPGVGVHE